MNEILSQVYGVGRGNLAVLPALRVAALDTRPFGKAGYIAAAILKASDTTKAGA